ncbi:MAG: hypothetical protein Q9170_001299 [Blastenia crenularia]
MRMPENLLQKAKIALHGVQGLCWFCIPLLIYQAGIPQFNRTRRFSNAYAHAAIDVLLAIFWFAAFISVATWTNEGIKKGVGRPGVKGCDAFAWGDGKSRGSKCHLSQATIGMGVVIFLLFLATSFISIQNLLYYRRNGSLPGTTPQSHPLPAHDEDDQAKYAFSSNPHDEFDEDEERGGRGHEDSTYEVLHTSADDIHTDGNGLRPWGQSSNNNNLSTSNLGRYDDPDRIDTSYHGTSGISAQPPQLPPHRDPFRDRSPSPYRVHNPPLAEAEEDTGYHGGRYDPSPHRGHEAGDPFRDENEHGGFGGRAEFPEADYHRT